VIGWSTDARFAGQGVELFANTGPDVPAATRNNVVTNNLFDDLDGHAVFGSGPSEAGNIVRRNLAWMIRNQRGADGDPHDDYAQDYGRSILFSEAGGNLPDANPLLANPLRYDFHLTAGSPAIGTSDPAYTPPYDLAGVPRSRSAPSLGAYEYVP
jgi:hypothetical protein